MATNARWYKLDNTAMVVPASVHGSDTRVFRIVCELKEKVDRELLQQALSRAADEFSHFNVILRQGLFWYYLEDAEEKPVVEEDDRPACGMLYFPGKRNLMYRVTCFENRINLEMFHVLADGTGAFMFLRRIIINYLSAKHGIEVKAEGSDLSSREEKNDDAYRHFYKKGKGRNQLGRMFTSRAFQIRQEKDHNLRGNLLEGTVSSSGFIAIAREYKTTAGILTAAIYIEAVIKAMTLSDRKKEINICVPVNLRQYFPSDTARNFFGIINVPYHVSDYDGSLDSIICKVKESFEEQLTEENLRGIMNEYSAFANNPLLKIVPLFLKEIAIQFMTLRAQKSTTGTMSNIGRIKMPAECTPYIDRFSAFMATPNMQICVSSFEDRMVFGAVSAYIEHRVLVNFFRKLTELGLEVELGTNDYDVQPV